MRQSPPSQRLTQAPAICSLQVCKPVPLHMQAADVARGYFKDAPNVFVEDSIPINDGWTRDWGPTVRFDLYPLVSVCVGADNFLSALMSLRIFSAAVASSVLQCCSSVEPLTTYSRLAVRAEA